MSIDTIDQHMPVTSHDGDMVPMYPDASGLDFPIEDYEADLGGQPHELSDAQIVALARVGLGRPFSDAELQRAEDREYYKDEFNLTGQVDQNPDQQAINAAGKKLALDARTKKAE